MDLRVFDKSPQVVPLLVRLYESQQLYQLAHDKRPVAKAELSAAMAELLEVDLTPREQELLTDVLIALTRQAETDMRKALAERLAVIDNAPLRLVLNLINDDFIVAAPLLQKSRVLSDVDLIYIIKSQGPEYWHMIAGREDLSGPVIDILADNKDHGTAVTLSCNERITLTSYAIDILAEMAKASSDIARPLLSRPEIPVAVARRLYEFVGVELQNYIEDHFDLHQNQADTADVKAVVDDIVLEFGVTEPPTEPLEAEGQKGLPAFYPTEQMIKDARRMAAGGMINVNAMIKPLQRGQIASFIALLSVYSGLSPDHVHKAVLQPVPKGLAILCRALDIPKNEFSHIYLLTNRARTGDRLIDQSKLLYMQRYFEKVRPDIARRIIEKDINR